MSDNENGREMHIIDMQVGDKMAYCRCLQSSRFPYCDGTHAEKETGIMPIVVKATEKDSSSAHVVSDETQ